MKTNEREILLYYDPDTSTGKMTLAYARSVVEHVIPYPYGQTPSTNTSWRSILQALNMHPKQILNKADPYYQEHLSGKDYDDEGWLNIITHNPTLIKAPIAVRGKKAVLCQTPTDIYKLVT